MEKVKNFQRNYLESEKFFSKFSYRIFLKGKGKGKWKFPKPKSDCGEVFKKVSENENKTNYLNLNDENIFH